MLNPNKFPKGTDAVKALVKITMVGGENFEYLLPDYIRPNKVDLGVAYALDNLFRGKYIKVNNCLYMPQHVQQIVLLELKHYSSYKYLNTSKIEDIYPVFIGYDDDNFTEIK